MGLARTWVVALLIGSALAAGAGPRLLMSDDPPGPEVRAAAAEFLKRLADGDEAGAKALFAGDGAQAELLAAELRWATSCAQFRKAVEETFGASDDTRRWAFADGVRQRADLLPRRLIVANGDGASVAPVELSDGGLELHRSGGAWRVTHVELRPGAVRHQAALYRKMAETADRLRGDVIAGKSKDYASVDRAFEESVRPVMRERVSDEHAAPDAKAGTPAWKPKVDGPGLAALVGKPIASPEVAAFLDSMPGVPYAAPLDEDFLWVNHHAAGVAFNADLRDHGVVRVVMVYAGLTPAWGAYGGGLPGGVSTSDTLRDVERKLGRPPMSSGRAGTGYTADYPQSGITVSYAPRASLRDPDAPIYSVSVIAPDPNGPAAGQGPPAAGDKPRLAFRLVAPAGAPDAEVLTDPADARGTVQIAVERRALLDERDVADVSLVPVDRDFKQMGISLKMTPAGAAKLKAATAGNIGRQLAIVLDGRVLMAPMIRSQISSDVMINMGTGESSREAVMLSRRLHAVLTEAADAK